ncbi:hypothetical protein IWQ62_004674, partial [Dispira parvispora]
MDETSDRILRMEEKLAQLREQREATRAVIEEMELDLYGIPLNAELEPQRRELENQIETKINEGKLLNSYIQRLKERLSQHLNEQQQGQQVRQSVPLGRGRSEAPTVSFGSGHSKVPSNLPKFKDGPASFDDADEFLTRFQRVLAGHQLDPSEHWARLLPLCLNSTTAEWVETFLNVDLSWELVCQQFVHQFGNPQRTRQLATELFNMRYSTHESVADFCTRFQLLAAKAKIADGERGATELLVSQLPEMVQWQVQGAVEYGRIQNFTISEVCRYIHTLPLSKVSKSGKEITKKTAGKSGLYCQHHKVNTHNTADCRALKPHSKSSVENSGPRAPNLSKLGTPDHLASIICHRCKQKGHYANQCPQKSGQNQGKPRLNATFADQQVQDSQAWNDDQVDDITDHETDENRALFTISNTSAVDPKSMEAFTIPVLVNGHKELAFIDTGANCTYMAKSLVNRLAIPFTVASGKIYSLDESINMPRYGITDPVLLQAGP